MVRVNVELDLPPGVELLGYERSGDGHGFEVKFPLPDSCRCEKCGHEEPSTYEYKNTVYVVCDLDLWGQPSFLIFQPCFHRCSRCGHRQEHFASFKRKKVMYTYRFEEYVLRMLSAAVEGIKNKARVITKRCDGVKSSGTLWNRLILDLNRASEAVGLSIAKLRETVSGLKAVFLGFCT